MAASFVHSILRGQTMAQSTRRRTPVSTGARTVLLPLVWAKPHSFEIVENASHNLLGNRWPCCPPAIYGSREAPKDSHTCSLCPTTKSIELVNCNLRRVGASQANPTPHHLRFPCDQRALNRNLYIKEARAPHFFKQKQHLFSHLPPDARNRR